MRNSLFLTQASPHRAGGTAVRPQKKLFQNVTYGLHPPLKVCISSEMTG
jgi:hypothetical protein